MILEEVIHQYGEDTREPFNSVLFERDDNEIIEELKNVIISCQRSKYYTIQVQSFEVIESPIEVYNKLRSYEQERINRSRKEQDNIYDKIQIKDSKIKLLVINYIIGIKDKFENLQVLIAVPRFVNKYYFEIQGNYYQPMYQIVDGSTYNNANTNSKNANITQKTIFMPIKVFRFSNTIEDIYGNQIPVILYSSKIFNKNVTVFKYLLAKFGLMGTFEFSKIGVVKLFNSKPLENENEYIFMKNDIYLTVPKYVFDNDHVTQSLVYTILRTIHKDVSYNDLFNMDHWITHLDSDVNITNYSYEKGEKLLESLEGIYDPTTKRMIRLPEEDKETVYHLLLWMMRSFSDLMMKDNQDVSMKRIRMGEYIASLYAMKLSTGIHRIAGNGKRANIGTIRKAINIAPFYLINQITKCTLVNYRNNVNVDDAMSAIKFSLKGISGIGEKSGSNVSEVMRRVHPSHLGIVDLSGSSDSSPGLSSTISPYAHVDKDGYFKEFEEPNNWESKYQQLMSEYQSITGLIEVAKFNKTVLSKNSQEEIDTLEETKQMAACLVEYVTKVDLSSYSIDGMIIPAYIV